MTNSSHFISQSGTVRAGDAEPGCRSGQGMVKVMAALTSQLTERERNGSSISGFRIELGFTV